MDRTLLEIAGIQLQSNPHSADLTKLEPSYTPFFKDFPPLNQDLDINIDLIMGDIPKIDHLTKIYDSDLSWSMYQDGNIYCLVSASSPKTKEPYWLARFDRECTQVNVFCNERNTLRMRGKSVIMNPVKYPLDQLLLMYHLAPREGVLIHSAGVDLNGKGLIFPGKSGAGKSTLSMQLFPHLKGTKFLSDDRIVVRKLNGSIRMFGTPWPGDAGIAENSSAKLYGILFLRHGSSNEIVEIEPMDALNKLLPVVSIPWFDEPVMLNILNFCEILVTSIPAYELYFKPDDEVAKFLERYFSST